MKINNHLNDEINSMKEDKTKLIENENKLKLKINDMDIQIRKLKEDSMKKEKALNAMKIYYAQYPFQFLKSLSYVQVV